MSGPQFFQTIMGRQFFDGTMPRLAKAAERIADGLESLSQKGEFEQKKSIERDKSLVGDMATALFDANEDTSENPEYLRGQLELLCSTAESLATKEIEVDGLGEQRDAIEVFFCNCLTRGRLEGAEKFSEAVIDFYFKD